jgi:hypothetical protein
MLGAAMQPLELGGNLERRVFRRKLRRGCLRLSAQRRQTFYR